MTEALRDVPGVQAVEVSLESATATVQAGETVSLDDLRAAVVEAGYE
jgi:copper chaperone CopZ